MPRVTNDYPIKNHVYPFKKHAYANNFKIKSTIKLIFLIILSGILTLFSFICCTFELEVFIIYHPLDDHPTDGR